jgi:hypothetical protein
MRTFSGELIGLRKDHQPSTVIIEFGGNERGQSRADFVAQVAGWLHQRSYSNNYHNYQSVRDDALTLPLQFFGNGYKGFVCAFRIAKAVFRLCQQEPAVG